MKILCLLADIFFVPHIQKILFNCNVRFIDAYKGEDFDLLILDMGHKESYNLCKKFPEKSFCFGSHMDTEKMKKFSETGCKNVYPRSAFLKRLEELKPEARCPHLE